MTAINQKLVGHAPNGQELWQWEELDGSVWQEYWQPVPGGGLVEVQRIS